MINISTGAPALPPHHPGWRATGAAVSLVALVSLFPASAPPASPASSSVLAQRAAAPAATSAPAGLGKPANLQSSSASRSFAYPVLRNVEEALTNRDPKTNELVGELATKWERANPTT
jgi:hypothetical protein